MTFADKLKAWRASKRWTQIAAADWLSRATGVEINVYTLISWEQKRHEPHRLARSAIEKAIIE